MIHPKTEGNVLWTYSIFHIIIICVVHNSYGACNKIEIYDKNLKKKRSVKNIDSFTSYSLKKIRLKTKQPNEINLHNK